MPVSKLSKFRPLIETDASDPKSDGNASFDRRSLKTRGPRAVLTIRSTNVNRTRCTPITAKDSRTRGIKNGLFSGRGSHVIPTGGNAVDTAYTAGSGKRADYPAKFAIKGDAQDAMGETRRRASSLSNEITGGDDGETGDRRKQKAYGRNRQGNAHANYRAAHERYS